MPHVRNEWGRRGQKAWLPILFGVAIFSVALVPFWTGFVPEAQAAPLTSWNPKVSCVPQVYTIEQILGNKPNQYGGAGINGSIFKPGITSSFPPDSTKRWLAPGATPSGWNAPGPPCNITNVNGTISAFVQINGVRLNPIIEEDWSTRYDIINGGTAYSNGNQSDTTVNVYTANSGQCLNVNDTGCMHRIHIEIDHDWKGASYCGPSTTCDNSTLHSLTHTDTTPIDVQGFVFWDDGQTSCACHNFSGWELHPLTAWRLSGVSSDFSLSAHPNTLSIQPGASATSNISVNSTNLFTGPVTLSTSVSPAGLGATISPSLVTVPPGGTVSSVLNVTTSSSNSGNYDVTVSGTNGTVTRSVIIHVTVLTAFSLSANLGSFAVKVKSSGTSNITLTSKGGFSGTVHLSLGQAGCFGCVSGGITPTDLTLVPGGTASAILNVTGTSSGNATLTIMGTSGALSSSTTVNVSVQDFSISSSKTSLTLNFGTTDSSTTINIASQNHFAGTVTLSASTKPSGITSALDHSTVTLTSGGTGSAILSITGSNPGDYTITVNATSGFSSHSVTIAVKVLGDFSISSNKNALTLNPGATDNSVVVLVTSNNGLYGTINLTTQVSPTGPTATAQFPILKLSANGSNATSLGISAGMMSGTYKVNVTATFGSLSHSMIITLTVGKASVTVATSLSVSTIVAGGSVGDSSTLTGATTNAGGNVTYQVFAGNTCTGTPVFSQSVSVTNGVVPNSRLLQFNATGTYEWQATYSGDANNSPSLSSSCGSELLTVKVTATAVTTTLSSQSIVPGGVVSDSAILTGFFGGFSTGGTATYSVFAGTTCTGTPIFTQTIGVNSVNGAIPNSRNVQFNATGTYQWQVAYSGDANNGVSASVCGSETLSVGKASPSITTKLSSNSIIVGSSVTDNATVTGGSPPTGTVTFSVYSGSICSGTVVATKTVPLASGFAGPVSVILNSTGTFNWQAAYNGDASNNVATSACGTETLTVGKATVAVAESVSATTIVVGNSVNSNATVSGGFSPAGTVSFTVFSSSLGSCSGTILTSKTLTLATGIAGPFSVIFNSTGTFNWQAAYNGDANNNPNASPCKSLVVTKASPAIATTLSSTSSIVGSSVFDSASMTNGFQASGSVTYNLFTGNACSGTSSPVGSPVTVTGGIVPNSISQAFNTAGPYSWNGAYSGDANNNLAKSPCEPLTVNKANPTIATVLSQNPIQVGSSVTDSATLTNSFQAGGTVTYSFFSGSTCGGISTVVGSPVTVANSVVPNSAAQTFNTAGQYSWNAAYSGDTNNNVATSACEPLTVSSKVVSIATSLSSTTITVGGSAFDSATLNQATSTAGGIVTYNIFTSGTCSGSPSMVSTVTVMNAAVPNSRSVTFNSTAPVSWNAVYSGDSNNSPASSPCEPLTVSKTNPTITISLSTNPITIGQSITDSATLTGSFQAGGSVNYLQFSTGSCSGGSTIASTVTVTNNVVPSSSPINPPASGTYGFQASYSGDANNNPITSSCASLTVNKASPGLTTSLSQITIPVGSSVTDSATMTGGYLPSGTVAYSYFTGGSCTGPATSVGSTVTVTNGVVPGSTPQGFSNAGSYSWNAAYSGDGNNNAITSPCEPLTVSKASPSITTSLSANPITVGGSVSDFATMTGGFQAGGSATYFLFSTADCTGSKSQVSIVTVSNGVIPNSSPQTFSSAGTASWNLGYSGDANNNASTSPCEPLTVNKASPSISTTLSQNVITVGSAVSDSATMTNGFQAGGIVTYSFFSGSTCGGPATVVGSPVAVSNGIVPNSASQPFNVAGPYSWNAAYSGDANNNLANSPCEPLTVNSKVVAIATNLSPATITVGGSVFDSSVLTGAFSTAGGTVTYNLFAGGICSGAPSVISKVIVTNALVPDSKSVIFNSTSAVSWNAVYSGDASNLPATSPCEPLTINKVTPTLATNVSAAAAIIGSAFHDSATLTGAFNAGGTVSYSIFSNNACSGNGTPVGTPVVVANGVVPDSASATPSSTGSYSFQASYSGDTNNNIASSACEPFAVNKASPTITATLSANSIIVGGSASDSAVLAGGFSAGGTVTYTYFQGSFCAGPGTTVGLPVTMTNGVVPNSSSQTFSLAGPYSWNAIYNGDANNNAAASACEPLTVTKASPTISTSVSQNPITVGGSVFDSVTMTGSFQAGGLVSYNLFTGGTCSGSSTLVSTVTVTNAVVPNSRSVTFNSTAPVSWNAVYSGDTNNNVATSACEPLTVNPKGVSITTTLSSTTITVGSSVFDSATITGATSAAGGTVTYNFFTGGACSGSPTPVSTVTVTNGAVPNSSPQTFSSIGMYSWNAVYSGDPNNSGAPSICEPLTVNKTSPTISTSLSANPITVGQSITESATLTGSFQAGGSVTYLEFATGACSGSSALVSTFSVINGIVPSSSQITPVPSGTYGFEASYSGDANNNPITSPCASLTVNKANPTITTSLSLTTIPVGSSVFDSATMTGGYQPGGTVTYMFFSGGSCTGTATTAGSPVTVTNGVAPSSTPQGFSNAGSYSWNAAYNGDANNNAIIGPCEPLTVSKASPTISTTLSANPIMVGGSVSDSSAMTGGFQVGGTVTYNWFSGGTCGGAATVVSTVNVVNGGIPSSTPRTFSSVGLYSWNAVYSGDANNNGTPSSCEPLSVIQAAPSITTTVSGNSIPVGTPVHDSATLSNGFSPGGTVTYTLFSDAGCAVSGVVISTVTVVNGVVPDSSANSPTPAGAYSFQASYGGDANNKPVTGACEPFNVLKTSPGITTSLSLTTIPVGSSVSDSATMTGGYQPGGTVTYVFFVGSSCTGSSTTVGSPVAVTNGVVSGSAPQTFNGAGTYGWNAVYSGDANNNPVTSLCEPLTVNKASPSITTTLSANPVIVGGSVYDSAMMTGAFQAGGSATYSWFTTADCTGVVTTVPAVTVNLGVVPSSSLQVFSSAGLFSWNARYFGDSNNNPATSPCEPLTVSKASPTVSTNLSVNPVTVGGSVSDFATMTGGFQAGGSATYFMFSTADCTGPKSQVSVVSVSNGVIPSSIPKTFNTAGPYSWNLGYSGDANNNASTSPCELLTVNKANPSLNTALSQTTIVAGNSVSASATLTNSFQAGGTVTYSSFSGSTCSGSATVVGSPVTVSNGVVPNSASQTFNNAGPYSWNAVYSGDANNNIANSTCAALTVNPIGVAIGASLSSPTIVVGGSVFDSAVLTGAFSTAGGTVTYNLFPSGICSGPPSLVSKVSVTNSAIPNSRPVTFNSTSPVSWNAVYSGDANNAPATSLCEPLTIAKAAPTLATTVSATSATIGTAFHDSAMLPGAYNAGGTVSYSMFINNACSGSGTPVGSPVVVTGGVVPDSGSITPSPAGPYAFQASYSGDANNNVASSPCEPFAINKITPTVTTTLSANSIIVGGSAFDSATIAGGYNLGGTVTYSYFQNLNCAVPGTTVGPTVTIANGVVPNSSPQTLSSAGLYGWNAVYNGDQNNNAVASACEPFTVNKTSPSIGTTLSQNPIIVGGSVFDSAALTGATTNAGGTVTYNWFTGATCSGALTILPSVTVVNGGVPNSVSQKFDSVGPYSWNALYSGDSNNNAATSTCEPLTVNPTSGATISTSLSPSIITVGGSVTDSATLTGVTPEAGGTVTYNSFQTTLCTGTPGFVSTVTVVNGIVPGSASKTFDTAGSFSWNAVYNGDPNNRGGAMSACEPLTVNQASPGISTTISNSNIPVGNAVHDSASLSNGFNAGGTVTYTLFPNLLCAGSGTAFSTVSVSNGVISDSSATSPTPAGSYSFQASYSGDQNNKAATSSCEPFNVLRVTPTITSNLSPTTVAVGSSVSDTATMTGAFQAKGTVTYTLYTGNACSGIPTPISTVTVTNSIIPSSSPATPGSVDSFTWRVAYTGDENNNPATSNCAGLVVTKTSPAITTSLQFLTISVGDPVYDSASIAGSFRAGGTVTYSFYSGSTCGGSGTVVGSPVVVLSGIIPNSASQSFTLAGPYSWNAAYGGDLNNNQATSTCEPLNVVQAASALTLLPAGSITVGNSIIFSATLVQTTSNAGGTVTYNLYTSGNCQGTAIPISTVQVTNRATPQSRSWQFTSAGTFGWNAVYSGDPNNAHATSSCGSIPVSKATPTVSLTLSPSVISKGGALSGSATLTGGFTAGGTLVYNQFSSTDCAGTPAIVANVTVTNNVVPSSSSQTFGTDGKFGWKVVYSGDPNNNPATGLCRTLIVTAPPTLSVPGAQSGTSGSNIRFTINATDSSWNNITITASGLPSGAIFPGAQSLTGKASALFSWTPSDSQASADYTVTFTVDDGHGGKTSSPVTIHVTAIHRSSPLNSAIPYFVIALVAGTAIVLAVPLLLRRFRK